MKHCMMMGLMMSRRIMLEMRKKFITNKEKYNLRRFSSAKLAVRIPSTYNAMKKRGDLSELKTKRNTVLTRQIASTESLLVANVPPPAPPPEGEGEDTNTTKRQKRASQICVNTNSICAPTFSYNLINHTCTVIKSCTIYCDTWYIIYQF